VFSVYKRMDFISPDGFWLSDFFSDAENAVSAVEPQAYQVLFEYEGVL
jgi:hypothetical protein